MDALEALHQRVSTPRVTEPAPDADQRDAIYRAALRAADHALLRPWRFLVVEGEGLDRLGELFARAAEADNPALTEAESQALCAKPRRAPLILVAIASCREHPKVPAVEQLLSTGAAVQNMLNAAFAQGLGAFWRTGRMAYHPLVARELGLTEDEQIAGFLYLGTPAKPPHRPNAADPDAHFQPWPPV